jgi:prepilin-type N-terminal cleavage/methylation domain-containing protein
MCDRRSYIRDRHGFTLMELLVVLLVTGIIATIGFSSASTALAKQTPRLAANEFVTVYRLATTTARRYGRTVELHIDASGKRLWIEVDTTETGAGPDAIGDVRVIYSPALTIVSDRTLLCFDGRGLPTTVGNCEEPDATVTFTQAGQSRTITFTRLGRVSP